jgi:hypothetical protein
MAKYRFTLEEKIAATKAAILSRYTPIELKPGLRVRLAWLQKRRRHR